jgi:hypothetical protein
MTTKILKISPNVINTKQHLQSINHLQQLYKTKKKSN